MFSLKLFSLGLTEESQKEANRIYRLFCIRNPYFLKKGKVSIIAHSLGSAICADILSAQPTHVEPLTDVSAEDLKREDEKHFVFDTSTLFCVGSPVRPLFHFHLPPADHGLSQLAFFLHLGRGQLIARKGRERTQDVGKDVALDRTGRYGCMCATLPQNGAWLSCAD